MSITRKTATRAGLLLAGLWTLVLVAAFIVHPDTDNLATGFLIHAWFGVDALGAMTVGSVLVVALLQITACFAVGYLIGYLFRQFRTRTDSGS